MYGAATIGDLERTKRSRSDEDDEKVADWLPKYKSFYIAFKTTST